MALFQKSVLNKYLQQQDGVAVEKAYKKFVKYFFNPITQQNIRDINEEGFQLLDVDQVWKVRQKVWQ